jgi:hypothetical protein
MASVREATPAPGQTKADQADQVREMREAEAAQRAQAESEMRAEGLDPATGQSRKAGYGTGFEHRARAALTGNAGGTAAGAMLGALCYFVALAYLRGGTAGVKSWLAAKFVNKPTGTASPVPLSASTGSSTTTTRKPNSSGQVWPTGLVVPSGSTSALTVPASTGQPTTVLV